jgi:hypothetical protein
VPAFCDMKSQNTGTTTHDIRDYFSNLYLYFSRLSICGFKVLTSSDKKMVI